mmetsp:Transcript_15906/g.49230  ORF Transcript_15906/g.49230 Transcript_15906/m.49230 type:complete len:255 (+) Transcript_15906:1005-1769(+)
MERRSREGKDGARAPLAPRPPRGADARRRRTSLVSGGRSVVSFLEDGRAFGARPRRGVRRADSVSAADRAAGGDETTGRRLSEAARLEKRADRVRSATRTGRLRGRARGETSRLWKMEGHLRQTRRRRGERRGLVAEDRPDDGRAVERYRGSSGEDRVREVEGRDARSGRVTTGLRATARNVSTARARRGDFRVAARPAQARRGLLARGPLPPASDLSRRSRERRLSKSRAPIRRRQNVTRRRRRVARADARDV